MVISIKSGRRLRGVRSVSKGGRASVKTIVTKKSNDLEDQHQIAAIEYLDKARFRHRSGELRPVLDYLFAIPNGGKRHVAVAKKLKAMGVKRGVSDLFLPVPLHGACGFWIELKVADGKATADQLAWIDRMVEEGYAAIVVWGWVAAVRAIDSYLGGLYTAAGVRLKVDLLKG